jgi:hypothetical protein
VFTVRRKLLDWLVKLGGSLDGSMASCIKGLASQGFCLEMSFPSLWKDCMKKSSCGVGGEGVLRGFRRYGRDISTILRKHPHKTPHRIQHPIFYTRYVDDILVIYDFTLTTPDNI